MPSLNPELLKYLQNSTLQESTFDLLAEKTPSETGTVLTVADVNAIVDAINEKSNTETSKLLECYRKNSLVFAPPIPTNTSGPLSNEIYHKLYEIYIKSDPKKAEDIKIKLHIFIKIYFEDITLEKACSEIDKEIINLEKLAKKNNKTITQIVNESYLE